MKKLFLIILVVAFTAISSTVVGQVKVNEQKKQENVQKQEQKQEQKENVEIGTNDSFQETTRCLNIDEIEVHIDTMKFYYERSKKYIEENYKAGKMSKEEYDVHISRLAITKEIIEKAERQIEAVNEK